MLVITDKINNIHVIIPRKYLFATVFAVGQFETGIYLGS